ncbi:hypothetical protein [Alloalcanivorax gelatiniphagus]|uniref:Uncharacterized protein n=1 Tax=Alloalcanivorax gelatiniphagus TaxID=1194167 RepID=A0ABY2XI09_9GAMM|nr:hypothetical protein [Alloalcanivorax gelatiniphagus]TMW11396.1 hypothetical protein FGS76_15205 [Alloalcanivorax gelatiniphagus]|tara:strand:- start:67306 stop:67653 length:348 start_codon:yes stop_codon:yes gene_type:complete
MALSMEEKQRYHDLIQSIWSGSVSSSPSQITEAVADIVDSVLNQSYQCSENFSGTLSFLAVIGGAWILPRNIVKHYFEALNTWLSAVEGSVTYRACLSQAALNWKSPLVLALMGL